VLYRIVNPTRQEKPAIDFGKYYVENNHVDGANDVTKNNWLGIHMGNGGKEEDKKQAVVSKAFDTEAIDLQSAKDAYESVLKLAGCSLPTRDTLDERIINDVKNRTGRFIDVQGGFPHGTAYELTINAWPGLRSLPASSDNDKDGMPDKWEKEHGLSSGDPADASAHFLDRHYTNIEVYLNSLVK
jgi:hypothetical protein